MVAINIFFKTIFLALFNVILSIYLVKSFGLVDAAYSVFITELMSAIVSNYFLLKLQLLKFSLIQLSHGDMRLIALNEYSVKNYFHLILLIVFIAE